MAMLPILEFPDPRLRTKAVPMEVVSLAELSFQQLLDDMFETMYEAPGIGLAASQVDVHQRFMVIDVTEDKTRPLVFVNPEITARQGEQVYQEGCLSVPGIYADVTRSDAISVQALDRHGQPFTLEADGVLAVCIQHEM
ncbi:MAG: peptide deformylase, partial [Thermomonas sp.]